jgi:hypothetical protein
MPIEEVGFEGREIELSRRLVDQFVALVMGILGETPDNPVQGLLDMRFSQAHGAILAFRATAV